MIPRPDGRRFVFGHQRVLTQTLADTAPETWGGKTVTPRG
jgi:hypothetical protein